MPFKALSHLLLAANVSAETTKVGTWDREGFYTKQAIVAGEGVSAQGARIAMSLPSGCVEPFSGSFLDARLALSTDNIGFLFFPRGGAGKAIEAEAFKPELLGVTSKQASLVQLPGQASQRGRAEEELSVPKARRVGPGLGSSFSLGGFNSPLSGQIEGLLPKSPTEA